MQKGPRQDESLANILKNVSKVLRYSLMSEEELLGGASKGMICLVDLHQ